MRFIGSLFIALGVGYMARVSGYTLEFTLAILAVVSGLPMVVESVITSAIKAALEKDEE